MIRLVFLSTALFVVGLYAWKDWYKSLCALIVLMAFLEHPDMPRSMFGIQGLNPWNLLLLVIIVSWLAQRGRDRLGGHPPGTFVLLLLAFVAVVTTAFVRLMFDRQALPTDASTAGLISEYLVNTLKWIIPGLLLFDGCRSRSRLLWGLVSILSLYVLLSVQVIRWMPLDAVFNHDTLVRRSQRILLTEIGYHRVDLSVILAGASWGLFTARMLVVSPSRRTLILLTAGVVLTAQALTGGRGGYFAWLVVGLTLGLLRWRRCLLLAPVLAIVLSVLPGVAGRALEGLSESMAIGSSEEIDIEKLTAGRNTFWPLVIDKIAEEPILGHGRAAMERTGVSSAISEDSEEPGPDNPHSAYLEMLLDGGWVGLAVTLALFSYILVNSLSLIADRRSPVFAAIGGLSASLVIALLVGSITGQSFYPRECALGMWCASVLMLRVSVERARAKLSFAMHDRAIARTTPARPLEWWRPAPSSRPRPEAQVPHVPVPASSRPRSIDAPL
jgi:O-antigen ligase